MFSPVASGIFAFRNIGKTENGDIGRAPVALGQVTGVIKEIGKYDKTIAAGTKNAVEVFRDIAGDSKAFNYAGKGLEFLSGHVNPLICASSGLKVALADEKDKDRILLEEAGMLSFMFLGEGTIAKHYSKIENSKFVKDGLDKLSKTKALKPMFEKIATKNWGGKIASIIKGLAFVTVSITSSNFGENLTKSLLKQTDRFGSQYLEC